MVNLVMKLYSVCCSPKMHCRVVACVVEYTAVLWYAGYGCVTAGG